MHNTLRFFFIFSQIYNKKCLCIGSCHLIYAFWRAIIHLSQLFYHISHPATLIAFTTMGDRRHIRCIRLQHQALQWYANKVLRQLAILESQHATYTQIIAHIHHLQRYFVATTETVHHSLDRGELAQDLERILRRIATMNHHRQVILLRPTHLLTQCLMLLLLESSVPMVVETYLANGNERSYPYPLPKGKDLLVMRASTAVLSVWSCSCQSSFTFSGCKPNAG